MDLLEGVQRVGGLVEGLLVGELRRQEEAFAGQVKVRKAMPRG